MQCQVDLLDESVLVEHVEVVGEVPECRHGVVPEAFDHANGGVLLQSLDVREDGGAHQCVGDHHSPHSDLRAEWCFHFFFTLH